MSEKLELEFEKRLNNLQSSIETATGESYEDLTGAVQNVKDYFYVLKQSTTLNFRNVKTIEHIKVYIDWCTSIDFNSSTIKTMVGFDATKISALRNTFSYSTLTSIQEPLDFSNFTNAFNIDSCFGTSTLVDIRFVAESIKVSISFAFCVNLSNESKQSIFDGLAVVTTAQTLTLPAKLKILQSQVDSANAKGWTVAGGTVVSEEEYYG